ncbi:MAG: hypothetical protein MUO26_12435 [Methanotrichaceae archaeon]|nr:hypothetical protein [Methanotrichaceae archaeon]
MKKKYYHFTILIILLASSLALNVSAAEQVSLTIYVHEGDLNGTLLSDVGIAGQDAAGNNFEGITDSNGLVTISGQPGTWQFTLTKEGYDTLNLYYDVTETDEAAAYIQKST